jgi:predicted nucleotidyltransferase
MESEEPGNRGGATIAPIEQHKAALAALCRRFGVRRLDLFGSAAQGRFDPATSDLDFVVEFADAGAPGYARRYIEFAEALEALFRRPVDLLTERMIGSPQFRETLARTRRRVYEQGSARTTT